MDARFVLSTIPPPATENVAWARRNIPGGGRPGISASEIADACMAEIRHLLD